MSDFITLQSAIDMTTLYRKEKEDILQVKYQNKNILANSETFDKKQIELLLSKPGCEKIRVYYGMDNDLKVHALLVAVDGTGADILPVGDSQKVTTPGDDILENATRCPPDCGAPSPLNP